MTYLRKQTIILSTAALIALLCFASADAWAPASTPELSERSMPSSLLSLIESAYQNNPGIAAARLEWAAASERVPQAESLPDPMFGVTYTPLPMEKEMGSRRLMFMASQMFPGAGKRGLLGDRASIQAEAARLKLDIATRDAITELKTSYAELQYLQTATSLTRRQREFVTRLADISVRDYAAGNATFLDLASAQSQLAQIEYDLAVLEELRRAEEARVNSLLGRDPETPLTAEAQIDVPAPDIRLEDLYDLLETGRQETMLDELNERIGAVDASLARKAYAPDLNVGVVYDTPGKFDDPMARSMVRSTWTFTLEMNLPVWRRKNEAAKREAERRLEASRLRTDRGLDTSRAALADAYFRMRTSARLVELYRNTLAPQADKAVETAEALYNSGELTFPGLIESQSAWLNFNLALARARADLARNTASVERLTGTVIPSAGGSK